MSLRQVPVRGTERRSCPRCGERTANVQGLVDCPSCDWTDRPRGT